MALTTKIKQILQENLNVHFYIFVTPLAGFVRSCCDFPTDLPWTYDLFSSQPYLTERSEIIITHSHHTCILVLKRNTVKSAPYLHEHKHFQFLNILLSFCISECRR